MIPCAIGVLAQSIVHLVALESSSASLGTGVSPKIIEALDNSIRDQLQRTSHAFFAGVLISAFVVAVGVVLEGPEILNELWPSLFSWFTLTSKDRLHRFERVIKKIAFLGWLLIGLGVFGEGVFEGFQNRAEGQLQTFNNILLRDARLTAGTAEESAQGAADASSRARDEADMATVSSSSALALAQGARHEADSFAGDIKSAKEQATVANRKLADALQQVATAQLALDRIKTPRSLTNVPELISDLSPFKGTKYVFVSVGSNDESISLLNAIDDALQKSGWERDKSVNGFPAINPRGKDQSDFSVPVGLITGIQVLIESPKSLEDLKPLAFESLPEQIQAAIRLQQDLRKHVAPTSEKATDGQVHLDKGTSTTVRIAVGSKPSE